MTRIFYDFEFLENGRTIDVISVGLVDESGEKTYYAVNSEMDIKRIQNNQWLMSMVVPSLPLVGGKVREHSFGDNTAPYGTFGLDTDQTIVKPIKFIANEVRDFLQQFDTLELWAWYGAYDHVALAQLWGPMIRLPGGIPMYTNDLRQLFRQLGKPELPTQTSGVHNALEDAKHNLERFNHMMDLIVEGAKLVP